MSRATNSISVSRVSQAEFDQGLGMIAAARAEIEDLQTAATAAADARANKQRQSRDEFDHHVRQKTDAISTPRHEAETVIRDAAKADALLADCADTQSAYDDMIAWLTECIEICLHRIIGQIDKADLVLRIVTEAVADFKTNAGLELHVAPSDRDSVNTLIQNHPDRFAAVTQVVPNADLAEGGLVLHGVSGSADISVQAQLAALSEHIKQIGHAA